MGQVPDFMGRDQAVGRDTAPGFAEAYYNLGCLYVDTGRNQRAIQVLRRALDLKPDHAKAKAKLEQAVANTNSEGDGASRPPIPF